MSAADGHDWALEEDNVPGGARGWACRRCGARFRTDPGWWPAPPPEDAPTRLSDGRPATCGERVAEQVLEA